MWQFFKYTLASLLALVVFTGGSLGLLILGSGVLVAILERQQEPPRIESNSVLVYNLAIAIRTRPRPAGQLLDLLTSGQAESEGSLDLLEATAALQAAAKDDRIKLLYLQGSEDDLGAGPAERLEVRRALEVFRRSGKPIVAYNTTWDESEYDLASVATDLWLNPFGSLELNGLQAQVTYFAGALEKLGIGVQVTRAGQYKSAVEPFLRTAMSAPEREQLQALVGDRWAVLLKHYSQYRPVSTAQFQQLANTRGLVEASQAESSRAVDRLLYFDQVLAELRRRTDTPEGETVPQVTLRDYAQGVADKPSRHSERQVALLDASGPIVAGNGDGFQSAVIPADILSRKLRHLREDDDVRAIVLRLNTPGGSATASEIILRELQLTAKVKPVVVSMGDTAASGGYWIASGASRVFAEPTTVTGSIGVFGAYPNLQDLGDRLGIAWDGVKTAKLADLGNITRPQSPAELALLQSSVDRVYGSFLQRVADGRHLPLAKVQEIAQGRVWSGVAAQRLGLVDELGGLDAAIQSAVQLARLGENWQLQGPEPQPNPLQRVLQQWLPQAQQASAQDPLQRLWQQFNSQWVLLRQLNDPRGVYSLLPYSLDIR
jgi:protease-4